MRNAIDECAATSNSFDEFQSKLLEQFQISVIEHRGRYSYLHPDRQEHGFDTQSDLKNTLVASKQELKEMQTQFAQHRSDLRIFKLILPFKERSSTSCPASFAPFAHSFASTSELLSPRKLVDMINTFFATIKFLLFQRLF